METIKSSQRIFYLWRDWIDGAVIVLRNTRNVLPYCYISSLLCLHLLERGALKSHQQYRLCPGNGSAAEGSRSQVSRPAVPQAVPSLSRGQSYSRKVRRTGQLSGNKLPQQVVDQIQGSSGAAGDGTRDKAGDKVTAWTCWGDRVKVKTGGKIQHISKQSFRERSCYSVGLRFHPGSRARDQAGDKALLQLSSGRQQHPWDRLWWALAGGRGRSLGDPEQALVGFMTALEHFRVWSFIQHTKRISYAQGQKKAWKGFSAVVTESVRLQHFWLFNQIIH